MEVSTPVQGDGNSALLADIELKRTYQRPVRPPAAPAHAPSKALAAAASCTPSRSRRGWWRHSPYSPMKWDALAVTAAFVLLFVVTTVLLLSGGAGEPILRLLGL